MDGMLEEWEKMLADSPGLDDLDQSEMLDNELSFIGGKNDSQDVQERSEREITPEKQSSRSSSVGEDSAETLKMIAELNSSKPADDDFYGFGQGGLKDKSRKDESSEGRAVQETTLEAENVDEKNDENKDLPSTNIGDFEFETSVADSEFFNENKMSENFENCLDSPLQISNVRSVDIPKEMENDEEYSNHDVSSLILDDNDFNQTTDEIQPSSPELTDAIQPSPLEFTDKIQPVLSELTDEIQPSPSELTDEIQPSPLELTDCIQPSPSELTDKMQPSPSELVSDRTDLHLDNSDINENESNDLEPKNQGEDENESDTDRLQVKISDIRTESDFPLSENIGTETGDANDEHENEISREVSDFMLLQRMENLGEKEENREELQENYMMMSVKEEPIDYEEYGKPKEIMTNFYDEFETSMSDMVDKKMPETDFTVTDEGLYRCSYCCLRLPNFQAFELHHNTRHKEMYSCKHCGEQFYRSQDLAIHCRRLHTDWTGKPKDKDKKKKQKLKHKLSDGEPSLIGHEPKRQCFFDKTKRKKAKVYFDEDGNMVYKCAYCGRKFAIQQALASHVRNVHIYNFGTKDKKKKKAKEKVEKETKKSVDLDEPPVLERITDNDVVQEVEGQKSASIESLEDSSKPLPYKNISFESDYVKKEENVSNSDCSLMRELKSSVIYHCSKCQKWFYRERECKSHEKTCTGIKQEPKEEKIDEPIKEKDMPVLTSSERIEIKNQVDEASGLKSERLHKKLVEKKIQQLIAKKIMQKQKMKKISNSKKQNKGTAIKIGTGPLKLNLGITYLPKYFCCYCPSSYEDKKKMNFHLLRHIGDIKRKGKNVLCKMCGTEWSDISQLFEHLKKHASINMNNLYKQENVPECIACGKPFVNLTMKRNHQLSYCKNMKRDKADLEKSFVQNNSISQKPTLNNASQKLNIPQHTLFNVGNQKSVKLLNSVLNENDKSYTLNSSVMGTKILHNSNGNLLQNIKYQPQIGSNVYRFTAISKDGATQSVTTSIGQSNLASSSGNSQLGVTLTGNQSDVRISGNQPDMTKPVAGNQSEVRNSGNKSCVTNTVAGNQSEVRNSGTKPDVTKPVSLDDIPFQCGMCLSRFPNSQYLLHHITLHMKGPYVFKVEKDGKEKSGNEKPTPGNISIRGQSYSTLEASNQSKVRTDCRKIIYVNPPVNTLPPKSLPNPVTIAPKSEGNSVPLMMASQGLGPQILVTPTQGVGTSNQRRVVPIQSNERPRMQAAPDQNLLNTSSTSLLTNTIHAISNDHIYTTSIMPKVSTGSNQNLNPLMTKILVPITGIHGLQSIVPQQGQLIKNISTAQNSTQFPNLKSVLSNNSASPNLKSVINDYLSKKDKSSSQIETKKDSSNSQIETKKDNSNSQIETKKDNSNSQIETKKDNSNSQKDTKKLKSPRKSVLQPRECEDNISFSDSPRSALHNMITDPSRQISGRTQSTLSETDSAESDSDNDSFNSEEFFDDFNMNDHEDEQVEHVEELPKTLDVKEQKIIQKNYKCKNTNTQSAFGIPNFKKRLDIASGNWMECSYCLYLCRTESELKQHMRGHSLNALKNKMVKCTVCQKVLLSKWHLSKHMFNHTGVNNYKCMYCTEEFSIADQVVLHIAEKHQK